MKKKYWGILILLIAGFAYAQTEDNETGFEFPAGWVITAATATNLDASGQNPTVTINGTRVVYTDPDDDCAYGYHWSANRQFQYDVTVTPVGGINGAVIAWKLEGDVYGAEPHLMQSASYAGGTACGDVTGVVAADDLVLGGGPAASEVPTLGTYSFIAFIAIFAFLGVMFIRKRN